MLKKGSTSWLVWNIVEAIILFAAGLATVIFSGNKDFQKVLIIIVGIAVIIDAVLRVLFEVLTNTRLAINGFIKNLLPSVTASSIELATGICLITIANNTSSGEIIFKFLGTFLGILVLSLGCFGVLYVIILGIQKKISKSQIVANSIIAAALIGIGIAIIVFLANENIKTMFLIITGILMMLVGVAIFILSIKGKKKKKAEEVEVKETK